MPSNRRSTKWFVRVDYPRDVVLDKLKQVKQWIDLVTALAVFHVGQSKENPHFHMILELSSELQKQSLDVRFKNLFNVKGTQYSSKIWDGEITKAGAGSYLFHEESDDIVFNKGFSDPQIAELRKLNEQVKEVIAVNQERGTNKSTQRIIDKLDSTATREKIFHTIMDSIRKGDMYHPGFRMSQVIDEIYIKIQPDDNWASVKDEAWNVLREKNKWY